MFMKLLTSHVLVFGMSLGCSKLNLLQKVVLHTYSSETSRGILITKLKCNTCIAIGLLLQRSVTLKCVPKDLEK